MVGLGARIALVHIKAYITFVHKAATPYPTAPPSWQSDHPCACMLSMLCYTTKPPLTCCPWCAVLQEGNEITLNGVSFDSNRASNFGGAIRAQVRGIACSRVAVLFYMFPSAFVWFRAGKVCIYCLPRTFPTPPHRYNKKEQQPNPLACTLYPKAIFPSSPLSSSLLTGQLLLHLLLPHWPN